MPEPGRRRKGSRAIIEVDRNGNGYTDIVGVEIFDTNGNLIVKGCGTTVASRME